MDLPPLPVRVKAAHISQPLATAGFEGEEWNVPEEHCAECGHSKAPTNQPPVQTCTHPDLFISSFHFLIAKIIFEVMPTFIENAER